MSKIPLSEMARGTPLWRHLVLCSSQLQNTTEIKACLFSPCPQQWSLALSWKQKGKEWGSHEYSPLKKMLSQFKVSGRQVPRERQRITPNWKSSKDALMLWLPTLTLTRTWLRKESDSVARSALTQLYLTLKSEWYRVRNAPLDPALLTNTFWPWTNNPVPQL